MASGQLRLIETAAKSAKRMGFDMIGMEGFTCAGHPGEREEDIGNWVLFPLRKGEDILLTLESRVEEENVLNPGCQRTKDTFSFVSSRGCGDGKQLAAAIAMGAEGMNMDTR